MTMEVGAFEAKTQLSKLLDLVHKGKHITITKHGMPVARLVPAGKPSAISVKSASEELREIRKHTKGGKNSLRELREAGRKL